MFIVTMYLTESKTTFFISKNADSWPKNTIRLQGRQNTKNCKIFFVGQLLFNHNKKKFLTFLRLILFAFITGSNNLESLLEVLLSQIYIDVSFVGCGQIRTGDLRTNIFLLNASTIFCSNAAL